MTGSSLERSAAVDAAFARSNMTIHRSVLLFAVLVIGASLFSTPGAEVVSFFGYEVPVMCTFRAMTGMECPGCGLTRSFAFMAHGQVIEAFASHKAGPFAFVVLAIQIPWRLWRLSARSPAGEVTEPIRRA